MGKFCVLDTEATNTGKVDANRLGIGASVYDLGYIIADASGVVYVERRAIISDVFCDTALMRTAYYADKIPAYYAALAAGEAVMMTARDAIEMLRNDLKKWNVRDVWAYNARFDADTLSSTVLECSNGWAKFPLPYGAKYRDVWTYARTTICKTQKYKKYCRAHGLLTASGNASTSADAVGKYLRGSHYSEEHTALMDARDELYILLKCLKSKKKKPRRFL